MKIRTGILFIALFALMLSACAKRVPDGNVESMPFDMWVENKLVPHIVEMLDKHPMFKGQPFLLVSMKGDEVQSEIDDLSSHIRDKIRDGLMSMPGVPIAWRPAVKPWTHHRKLADIECAEYRKIRFYIGIDVGLRKLDQELCVKVRGLNLDEKIWVSGSGISWSGKPSTAQLEALKNKSIDEHLRGLRPLPFIQEQPDLLAAYLSQNLSCLFRQRDLDKVIIHVEHKNMNSRRFFNRTLNLLDSYLARFREVSVTDDPNQANVKVIAEALPIHGDLYQVWVSARYKEGKIYVPGTETEAYVYLDPDKGSPPIKFESDQSSDRKVHHPMKHYSTWESVYNLFFYGFPQPFRENIYPVLEQAPGMTEIKQNNDLCDVRGCICYELKSRMSIKRIAKYLRRNLSTSQARQFRLERRGDSQLHLYFDRGFE